MYIKFNNYVDSMKPFLSDLNLLEIFIFSVQAITNAVQVFPFKESSPVNVDHVL